MDALVDDGIVVLGGPVGEGDGKHVLLVVDVAEAEIRARLAADPGPTTCSRSRASSRGRCGCARSRRATRG